MVKAGGARPLAHGQEIGKSYAFPSHTEKTARRASRKLARAERGVTRDEWPYLREMQDKCAVKKREKRTAIEKKMEGLR